MSDEPQDKQQAAAEPEARPQREYVPITNERGQVRNYETVPSRVFRFRHDHPEWPIQTEILEASSTYVRIKASIGYFMENGTFLVISTGHAEEWRDDGDINRTNAVENCETSAIGRALAFAGYGSADSIASADEVKGAIDKRQELAEREPGALAVLQNAARSGYKELSRAWKHDISEIDRKACTKYMRGPKGLTAQAKDVDAKREAQETGGGNA